MSTGVYGYESCVALKDIWNGSDREVESIARWMAETLIDAAERDAAEVKKEK